MTTINLKSFSGELPSTPAYALPDTNAQQALNCDFSQRDLRPIKGGTLIVTMANTPVKGIYTDDGVTFFTWTTETQAYKGPVIGDAFDRVYYMNNTGFFVTTGDQAQATGGAPASSWTVGVPQPTVAPTLTINQRANIPGYGAFSVTFEAWYELAGTRYDVDTRASTTVTNLYAYSFVPPTRSVGTPADAKLYCRMKFVAGLETPIDVTVAAGSAAPARTDSLPGGVEVTLTGAGQVTLKWGVYETRSYVYTLRNTFGEESAPSPAATVDVTYIQDVTATVTIPSFTGYRPLSEVEIYRTFGTSGQYFNVNTSTLSSTQFQDTTYKSSDLGTALTALEYFAPASGMFGLTLLPSGAFCAFKDNVLYFSEPNRPHAWPYSISFPLNIRGVRLGAQSVVVTTADGCYMVLGSHPSKMASQLLPVPQAGINNRSMALINGAVAFLSNDGIVAVEGSRASLDLSQQLFTRETWRNRYSAVLNDLQLAYHDGALVAASSSTTKGFIARLDEASGFSQLDVQYDAMFYLPLLDTLYYSQGANVYRFRTGSYMAADWWSKDFVLGKPINFGAFYIRCSGSVTVSLYADGVLWDTFTMTGTGYRRLPAGKRALSWSVRLQTSAVVEEVAMAEAMGELRSV